jgi:hypothetical protein
MHHAYTSDLDGIAVLLMQDDPVRAIDATTIIELTGGRVVGPGYNLRDGFACVKKEQFDCAAIDVTLNGELAFGLADALVQLGVPFIFLSAHSLNIAPPRYREHRLVHWPFSRLSLIRAIQAAVTEQQPLPLQATA